MWHWSRFSKLQNLEVQGRDIHPILVSGTDSGFVPLIAMVSGGMWHPLVDIERSLRPLRRFT